MKSVISLSYCVLAIAIVTRAQPHNHNDILKRHEHRIAPMARNIEKRAPQISLPNIPGGPSETPTTTRGDGGGGENTTSTSTRDKPPEESTTTRSRSVSTPTDDPATSTSTSTPESTSTSTTESSSSSSSSSQQQAASSTPRTTAVMTNTRFASQGSSYVASRSSATVTETASGDASSSSPGFLQNKSALAATITVAILVVIGALVFIAVWLKKKAQRGKMAEEDMWDEASMKEFSRPGGAGVPITPPPPAPVALADDGYQQSGLARSKTVLPSQSAGAAPLARSRSQHPPRRDVEVDEEPDQILAMPPVTHFERPRDSAYDIVPAAPPAAAFASGAYASQGGGYTHEYSNAYASGSGSGGLVPPKRAGDHSSFGSGLGSDPFAGTGFVDATRESTYGPGQAGRGAGYNMNPTTENAGNPHMGSQWPQGYNPYTGYGQGGQSPYTGYGYAQ